MTTNITEDHPRACPCPNSPASLCSQPLWRLWATRPVRSGHDAGQPALPLEIRISRRWSTIAIVAATSASCGRSPSISPSTRVTATSSLSSMSRTSSIENTPFSISPSITATITLPIPFAAAPAIWIPAFASSRSHWSIFLSLDRASAGRCEGAARQTSRGATHPASPASPEAGLHAGRSGSSGFRRVEGRAPGRVPAPPSSHSGARL